MKEERHGGEPIFEVHNMNLCADLDIAESGFTVCASLCAGLDHVAGQSQLPIVGWAKTKKGRKIVGVGCNAVFRVMNNAEACLDLEVIFPDRLTRFGGIGTVGDNLYIVMGQGRQADGHGTKQNPRL